MYALYGNDEKMIGKTISCYRILEKLGEGGMGVVYKAEDTKLERAVALKFLSPHTVGGEEERARFIREAKAAAALDHPGICSIYEIDDVEGHLFIAMAYVDGQSLAETIESGPLILDDVLDIAVQAAEGLGEAHRAGIVHRDVKSANIMLTGAGRVKLMDFGLAKLMGKTRITETASILGTVDYMSPEQARGEAVDHRTDIWSLGVTLYEMLTGTLPFVAPNDAAVIHMIIYENPEPVTNLRRDVPAALEHMVQKMMQKDPRKRYATMEAVLSDLNAIRSYSTTLAPAISKKETVASRGMPALFPLPPMLSSIESGSFIGRERELTQLRQNWARVCEGQRRLVLLTGEAGIGKTRLAAEFASCVRGEGAIIIYGGAMEGAVHPYQPFVEALRHYATACPPDMLRAQLEMVGADLTTLAPELADRLSGLSAPVSSDPGARRCRIFDAFTAWLIQAAEVRTVILVLDDLHWADRETALLLRHIVRSTAHSPILLLGTYRETEITERDHLTEVLADLRSNRAFQRVSLRGLNEREVSALIGSRMGQDVSASLAKAVFVQTEGSPLFVEEVLRHLSETGAIYQRDDTWTSDLRVEQMGIPEGIKGVINQRLARLSEDCGSVLTIASVIGRTFGLEALERASDLSGDRLFELLEEAVKASVIEEVPHSVGRYMFSHALIYETLYDQLTTTRRVRLHGQVLQYADNRGVKLAYEVLGVSGPYLFALGLGNSLAHRSRDMSLARHWDRLCRLCRVILYDRRGVGFSAAPERGYSLLASADDARTVIDAVGVERTFLWGSADGGPLAIAFAAQYPERVAGLILAGTSPKLLNSEDFAFGINPAAMASFRSTDSSDRGRAVSHLTRTRSDADAAQGHVEVMKRVPRHAWSKITGAIGAADARSFLSKVQAPSLILHDPDNNYIPTEAAHYLHERLAKSRLEVTEKYRVMPYPDTIYDTIEGFMTEAATMHPI